MQEEQRQSRNVQDIFREQRDALWEYSVKPYQVYHCSSWRIGWVVWQHEATSHCVIWFPYIENFEWRRQAAFIVV